ncbi:MAG: serine hydrolase [Acidimicrobiia bacterium]|nr:serine hydrolase [Acidimicrobiia bacterium]
MPAVTVSIDDVLRTAVESGDAFGVVATAADEDGPVYEGAFGLRSADSDDPMRPDSMLRIASMTKMVTTTAALQQVERGAFGLDDPVDTILPAFADLGVLDGWEGGTPRLRPPASRATVRQLMSHTSGLSYWFWNEGTARYQEATGLPDILSGLDAAFVSPLACDPGTRFEYGINTDWLGKAVEAASGQSLDAYLAEHVTGPLGMLDTTVRMDAEQRARSVPVHVRGEDGGFEVTELDWAQEPEFWGGGHALYSTALDYLRFQRMLLGGGALEGERVLGQELVDEAFRNQIGELFFEPVTTVRPDLSLDVDLGPGQKFGLGLLLNTLEQPGMRAAGSGAWAGIFNSHFWVDRANGLTGAIYLQLLPFFDPRSTQLYGDFEKAVYASR